MPFCVELTPPKLTLEDDNKLRRVENILSRLIYDWKTCSRIKRIFQEEMERGLRSQTSSLQMANTYVTVLPTGRETGQYLALDLGGTNLRILFASLENGKMSDVQFKHYDISERLRLGDGKDLFEYLADCIIDFLEYTGLKNQSLPLGFTFSFPMTQRSLQSGILVKWTKSFNCPGVEGKDVAELLIQALRSKGCYNVYVGALLNDTTGTLMMGSFMDPDTTIGLILGTGSNACYLERSDKVEEWSEKQEGEYVVIDVEWGAFGDNGVLDFIQTDYDVEVDNNSLLVNSFTFEKYISGKYLGEVVRVVLVDLVKKGLLFDGSSTAATLSRKNSFPSKMVSDIEKSSANNASEGVEKVMEALDIRNYSKDDVSVIQYVCNVVSNRSALLVSICLSALLERIDRNQSTIAIDGSLYTEHPRYHSLMVKYLNLFTEKKFKLIQAKDGSGLGATLVAATAAMSKPVDSERNIRRLSFNSGR